MLCSHYKLDDVCATSEIGETDDIHDMYTKHKELLDKENSMLRFSVRDMEEAQDEEDQDRTQQEEKLLASLRKRVESGAAKLSPYEERILNGSLISRSKVAENEDLLEESKAMREPKLSAVRSLGKRRVAKNITGQSSGVGESKEELTPLIKSDVASELLTDNFENAEESPNPISSLKKSSATEIIDLTEDDDGNDDVIFDIFKSSSRTSSSSKPMKPPLDPMSLKKKSPQFSLTSASRLNFSREAVVSESYFPEKVEDGNTSYRYKL